jgi:serine/threonine-protein kinase
VSDPPVPGDRRARLDAILRDALDLPPGQRRAFVEGVCGSDAALASEALALLRDAETPDSLLVPGGALAGPLGLNLAADPSAEGAPVGPFRIVREIGRGGMGVVYLAERAEGGFRQQVALKIAPGGAGSEDLARRFERERQIVASLEHPNIARLLDGGVTAGGRPYFAMEYVDGERIDLYCDRLRLGVEERIALFRTVAAAVQHAHANLLVHRDLKPGNILISRDGRVKLLDFGIAKPLGDRLPGGDETLTREAGSLMTPGYASPEQARGEVVSTASDVYQLGLLLYELLTGRRAQRLEGLDMVSAARAICGDDPQRPSDAVCSRPRPTPEEESAARARGTSPAALARHLRGDLDSVVMMAIRKEPEDRYHTPAAMAEDLERALAAQPVRAGRGTTWYRARKFVRRHRFGVAAGAAIALLLAGYAVTVTVQAGNLKRERDRVRLEARKAQEVRDFLVSLFKVSDPNESRGETPTARDLLEAGAARVTRELAGQPEVRVEMLGTLGEIYYQLGQYDRARSLLEEANGILDGRPGAGDAARGLNLCRLGSVLRKQGRYDEAEKALAQGEALLLSGLGPDDGQRASCLGELATSYYQRGDYGRAQAGFEAALAAHRRRGDELSAGMVINNLGLVRSSQEDYKGSEAHYRQALEIVRRHKGADHPQVAINLFNVARSLQGQGDFAGAEPLFREALEINLKALGEDHPEVGIDWILVANTVHKKGDPAGSEALFLKGLAILEKSLPPEHPRIADGNLGLGRAYLDLGRLEDARARLDRALRLRQAQYGPDDWHTAEARLSWGAWLGRAGRRAEGEAELLRARAAVEGKSRRLERETARLLAELYDAWGRPADAAAWRQRLAAAASPSPSK